MIVVGDSDFRDQSLVLRTLDELHAQNPIAWVLTGGAREFDRWSWEWARSKGVEVYRYFPKWGRHGRFAGFEVSRRLLRSMFDPKTLLVFHAERVNPSTTSLIGQARKKGIEVVVRVAGSMTSLAACNSPGQTEA